MHFYALILMMLEHLMRFILDAVNLKKLNLKHILNKENLYGADYWC